MPLVSQIKSLNAQITYLGTSNSAKSKCKIAELKKEEFDLLENELSVNTDYQKLAHRNLALLEGEEVKFIVYDIENSRMGSYAKEMEGAIRNNGHLYYECEKINVAWTSLDKHLYPKRFVGRIDAFGRSWLEVKERGFSFFFPRLPETFTGEISAQGEIDIKIKKSGIELLGTIYMSKLVCDPFGANQQKKTEFMENREKLLKMMRDLREEILRKT